MAEATVKVKYFQYTQNNSGGYFTSPAEYVIIEAVNAAMANQLAGEFGVDEDAPFCSCCGRRWNLCYSDEEGDEVPSVYGNPVTEAYKLFKPKDKKIPDVLVVYLDGRQEFYTEK